VWNVPFVIDENEVRLTVSRMAFAYDNIEVISKLTERGSILTSGNLDKMQEVDDSLK